MKKILWTVLFLSLSQTVFADPAPKKIFLGEKLTYQIFYLGVPIGESEAEVKEIVKMGNRQAFHVVVKARSYRMIDLVYKVRDEHHSYIDTEKLYSLRYEKSLKEGKREVHQVIVMDQDMHFAHYENDDKNIQNVPIPNDAQDELSCGYWFRTLDVVPETSVWIPVHADKKNWRMEVRTHHLVPLKIKNTGQFEALEIEPLMDFQGVFVKRGKIRGWMSSRGRKIPLKMTVKIPVIGSVTAELTSYRPGND